MYVNTITYSFLSFARYMTSLFAHQLSTIWIGEFSEKTYQSSNPHWLIFPLIHNWYIRNTILTSYPHGESDPGLDCDSHKLKPLGYPTIPSKLINIRISREIKSEKKVLEHSVICRKMNHCKMISFCSLPHLPCKTKALNEASLDFLRFPLFLSLSILTILAINMVERMK